MGFHACSIATLYPYPNGESRKHWHWRQRWDHGRGLLEGCTLPRLLKGKWGGSQPQWKCTTSRGSHRSYRLSWGRWCTWREGDALLHVDGAWPTLEQSIQGYTNKSDSIGTQESTAQTPFPKVIVFLPKYMFLDTITIGAQFDSFGDD
jgi:hypothetical protein